MTLKQAAQKAIEVQDELSPRGIARAMVESMDAIAADKTEDAEESGNQIIYLFLHKLATLNGDEVNDLRMAYPLAVAECKRLAFAH